MCDPPVQLLRAWRGVAGIGLAITPPAFGTPGATAQANGSLQIHFMNVGQGDGALLVSPGGQTVLFDSGVRNNCDLPLAYLDQLGLDSVDYHIASVIAGGAIQLLITNVADDGGVVRLSAAALAFVAGYNSELLFQTVERVSAALLPKVGASSVRRADQDPMAGVSVRELIEMLDKVEMEEAKEAVRGLLARMKQR